MFDSVKDYLLEGWRFNSAFLKSQVVSIDLPLTVELVVTETAPAIKEGHRPAKPRKRYRQAAVPVSRGRRS
ncbi:MAG: hypothetical protein R2864_05535 [Syntrophotaleaceae bacterium]